MAWRLLWGLLVAAAAAAAAVRREVPALEFAVEPTQTQFPVLGENHTLDCDCAGLQCEQVVWFRTLLPSGCPEVLGGSNQADRVTYGPGLDHRVRISKRSGSGYTLRILNTTTADRGVYCCVLKVRGKNSIQEELWRSGVLLLPGESSATEAPQRTPRAPLPSHCPCPTLQRTPEGCGRLVLWPLVGLTSALSVTLLCTLYYYSRLPRKCRHHFVRKK